MERKTSGYNLAMKTNHLLWAGICAGPVYLLVSIAQILTREGFDLTRHSWSVLSNGDLGWIHITNFLVTGILTILGALGIKKVLKGQKGGTWAPRLLMLYGFCLILSGIFKADPVDGFPPGTPFGPPTSVSTSGILHLVFGLIGFIGLISASIILSKHFQSAKKSTLAKFSLFTGVYFGLGFLSLMIGGAFGQIGFIISNFAFTLAVIISWIWYSSLLWHLLKESSRSKLN